MSITLTPGKSYNFSLHPQARYGANHTGLQLLGSTVAAGTSMYGTVASEVHELVYPSLPPGTPDDPNAYTWLIFKTINGEFLVIGEPWIVDGSLVENTETKQYLYTIPGDSDTPARVKAALNSIGIYDFTVEVK